MSMQEPTRHNSADITRVPTTEYNLEQVFDIYKIAGGKHYFYNILRKIQFPLNMAPGTYTNYITGPSDTWTLISHKHYNQIELWWLIAGANHVNDTFTPIRTGVRLKIPTPVHVRRMLDDIATQL